MSNEPEITINGHSLTEGQAMTVRVAIQNFALTLADGLGADATGKAITTGYLERIGDLNQFMAEKDSNG